MTSPKATERKVAQFSPARAETFQNLVATRTARIQERLVLERLVEEKKAELSDLASRLQQEYGMAADRTYQYSATNRTLYLVEGEGESARNLPHRAFVSEEEAQKFLRVLVAKRITDRQLTTFQEVVREKELETNRAAEQLRGFGVRPEGQYRYDADERVLWEIVPAPKPAPKPSSKPVAKPAPKPASKTPPKPVSKPVAAPSASRPAAVQPAVLKPAAKTVTPAK